MYQCQLLRMGSHPFRKFNPQDSGLFCAAGVHIKEHDLVAVGHVFFHVLGGGVYENCAALAWFERAEKHAVSKLRIIAELAQILRFEISVIKLG